MALQSQQTFLKFLMRARHSGHKAPSARSLLVQWLRVRGARTGEAQESRVRVSQVIHGRDSEKLRDKGWKQQIELRY